MVSSKRKDPTFRSWRAMRDRCLRETCPEYHYYGGRGISICPRWSIFENFLADMGPRPPGTSLDRINNDGNYSPDNCRWATPAEQTRNRRSNRMVEWRGEQLPLIVLCERTEKPYWLVKERLKRGWSVERAILEAKMAIYDSTTNARPVSRSHQPFSGKSA